MTVNMVIHTHIHTHTTTTTTPHTHTHTQNTTQHNTTHTHNQTKNLNQNSSARFLAPANLHSELRDSGYNIIANRCGLSHKHTHTGRERDREGNGRGKSISLPFVPDKTAQTNGPITPNSDVSALSDVPLSVVAYS